MSSSAHEVTRRDAILVRRTSAARRELCTRHVTLREREAARLHRFQAGILQRMPASFFSPRKIFCKPSYGIDLRMRNAGS